MKSIAFFITSTGDTCTSINGVSYNESIATLVTNSQGTFWIQNDEDGVSDLCTEITNNIPSISGIFIHNNVSYNLTSHDFVGGRPTRRIPK